MKIIWVTGASSGIGRALLDSAPAGARTVAVARRNVDADEALALDLSDPTSWTHLLAHVERETSAGGVDEAVFVHLAGAVGDLEPAAAADPSRYLADFLLNAGSTIALGQAFLKICADAGVKATLVVTSSPAASDVLPGMSQYSSSKAAISKWTEVVAKELEGHSALRVLGVVPYAVDTPMLRAVLEDETGDVPLSEVFRDLEARGQLATAESAAAHIWEAIDDLDAGPIVTIGARWLASPEDVPQR